MFGEIQATTSLDKKKTYSNHDCLYARNVKWNKHGGSNY
ncbi:hypothetical protein J2W48_001607 [Flavobacterium piscis]|uniref:Uncharacterized protein n=1 Tax=Flavobacterium piscis TaxID=1114874 RepID=A0ABU1Y625_9FLAO|nr:hypothetical protein [Flavobacterium piscis]